MFIHFPKPRTKFRHGWLNLYIYDPTCYAAYRTSHSLPPLAPRPPCGSIYALTAVLWWLAVASVHALVYGSIPDGSLSHVILHDGNFIRTLTRIKRPS